MAAVRSGRADIVTSDEPDTPALLRGTPNVRVVGQSSSEFYVVGLNAIGKASKLRDERVRQAIALALDRQQIIDLALGGGGEAVQGPTVPGLSDACEPTSFSRPDPERARQLLAEAGAEGLEFEIMVDSGMPVVSRLAQVIQAQLEEVGLRPTIEPLEQGAWLDRYFDGDFDGILSFISAFVDNWFGLWNWSPSAAGFTKSFSIDDPVFNRLLSDAAKLEPGEERAAAFQRMCELATSRADMIPLATRTTFVAYRTDRITPVLQKFEPNGNTLKNVAEFAGS